MSIFSTSGWLLHKKTFLIGMTFFTFLFGRTALNQNCSNQINFDNTLSLNPVLIYAFQQQTTLKIFNEYYSTLTLVSSGTTSSVLLTDHPIDTRKELKSKTSGRRNKKPAKIIKTVYCHRQGTDSILSHLQTLRIPVVEITTDVKSRRKIRYLLTNFRICGNPHSPN